MLDGASRIKQMFARAKELDMPALALTDHGVMYGAIPFYLEGRATGVKPLIGMEAYVAPRSRFDRPAQSETWYYHLTLIAANLTGYQNLVKLSSLGFLEGYDSRSRRPRLDKELLGAYSDGIIALSGCLSGEIPKLIENGKLTEARSVASEYREIFKDRYFLEVQSHGVKGQDRLNEELRAMGTELGLSLTATNDSHYTHREDAEAHDILLCIQTGKQLTDTGRLKFDTEEFYLKSPDEMRTALREFPDAIENTLAVADMCDLEIPLGTPLLPSFTSPGGEDNGKFLYRSTMEGLDRLYSPATPEARARAEREMQVIEEMGFVDYFLIVSDFVNWARSVGIRVGPGRGSVGGSIVAYALGITGLDPIKWNLGFERFLNRGRKQMPDIDIDFDDRRRGEVIRYVCDKYGDDRVAQIITFQTIKAKAALRDAARVLGMPYAVGDKLAKMYPPLVLGKEAPFSACFDKNEEWPENTARNDAYPNATELRKAYEEDDVSTQVINTARKLEGLRRQHSVHAAGVVIGPGPLTEFLPVQKTDQEVVTQYEMNAIEQVGLLKIDFLGLRNLTVISDTLAHIEMSGQPAVDVENIPLDDPAAYKLLQDGQCAGIFQMESPGMVRLCRQLKPDRFGEIAALIALFRPGPMEEISKFIKGKHDPSSVRYFHPLLTDVLADTYGVIVYQEQVTEILQTVAGFSAEDADVVRYAIGKKKSDALVVYEKQFDAGCRERGLTANEAKGLWELIRPFAGYSFNRAHANGYGLIAYQTAWLKVHHPVEYMASVLTSVKDKTDRMPYYLAECRSAGIDVLTPNINESLMDFTPREGKILFGLSAIKNVGEAAAIKIIEARRKGGPFVNFHDFARRVDSACLNKKVIESVGKAGGFDSLGVARAALLMGGVEGPVASEAAMFAVEAVLSARRREEAGQFSLFAESSSDSDAHSFDNELTVDEMVTSEELLKAEKEVLGFYISAHPLSSVWSALRYQAEVEIPDLSEEKDGAIRTVGGILTGVVPRFTKKGDRWFTAVLEDMKAEINLNIWPQTASETSPLILKDDSIVLITGRLEVRDEGLKLMAQKIVAPDLSGAATPLRIKMPAASCTPVVLEELKTVLSSHPGPSPVLLHLASSKRNTTVLRLADDYRVELRNGLFAELKSVLGPGAVV